MKRLGNEQGSHSALCCRSLRAPRQHGAGQVARGTFSGPRSRGKRISARAPARHHQPLPLNAQDTANGACARAPNHLPWARAKWAKTWCATWGAAGRWWCPRAQAPFAVAPQALRARAGVTRLAVVQLGGAPRAWAGERGHRRRPATMNAGRTASAKAALGQNDRLLWAECGLSFLCN